MVMQEHVVKLKISNPKEKERKIFTEFPIVSVVIRLRFVEVCHENGCQNSLSILQSENGEEGSTSTISESDFVAVEKDF
jgi:hypothetical protein